MTDPQFWLAIRQAILMIIDAIERKFDIKPTTADIRKAARKANGK